MQNVARWRWITRVTVTAMVGGVGLYLALRAPPRMMPLPLSAPPAPVSASVQAEPAPRPASAEELSLVSPIVKGSLLAGFQVREIQAVRDGVMRVVCGKDKAIVRLDIALVDDDGVVPPATAGKFAVFYSLRGALPEEGERLARKLADVLVAHAGAPPPPGMTKFRPKERPGVSL